ncbi:hypothetical protein J4558_15540 [Leptolyngbya sp. 15MV]|nr:hypothetical protein J4558_15540 [Leptolyngbya sp. 15MV]
MSVIANERTKLLASALDRASTACFTVGVATPLAGWIYDIGGLRTTLAPEGLAVGISGWLFAAILLHLGARRLLGSLKP